MPDVIYLSNILLSNTSENLCLYENVRWIIMMKYSIEELFMKVIGICIQRFHIMC